MIRDETQISTVSLVETGGALALLRGRLYRDVQVRHPRNARFSLQNEHGLFFIKVQQARLVKQARELSPGDKLIVIGAMHSFVNRRCKNHHVFVNAVEILPLNESSAGLMIRIEKE